MFMDLKRSTQYLKDHQSEYMFSEVGQTENVSAPVNVPQTSNPTTAANNDKKEDEQAKPQNPMQIE